MLAVNCATKVWRFTGSYNFILSYIFFRYLSFINFILQDIGIMDIYHYLMDEISGKLDRWRSSDYVHMKKIDVYKLCTICVYKKIKKYYIYKYI